MNTDQLPVFFTDLVDIQVMVESYAARVSRGDFKEYLYNGKGDSLFD